MARLDFVCIGAQKAGTTALHDTLQLDSRVKLANNKEAHWFEIEEKYILGVDKFFEKFYGKDSIQSQIIGLINPNLILKESALERLKKNFPEVKIIYILRDPLERAWSHYQMSKVRGIEKRDFSEALDLENERISNPQNWIKPKYKTSEKGFFELNHYSYQLRGDYQRHLDSLYGIFEKDKVLICDYDKLRSDSENFMREIYAHIGLDFISYEFEKSNVTRGINLRNVALYNSRYIRIMRVLMVSYLPKKIRRKIRKKIRNRFLGKSEKLNLDMDVFEEKFKNLQNHYKQIKESL